ncbi:glycoside hydrolase family 172 protein [Prevotella sp. 10(H)]|uniref:glycoside hydrolase family 172 protein n=1 Tax=Prevotella sp. 10(H) TaxID=1158294 RepID=UPI0004A6D891|nr:glycoside hydrolase family 172 protein [Prevotella sp. 10(H)]
MKQIKHILLFIILIVTFNCCNSQKDIIKLESLLDEMVSVEELSRFPDPYYTCHQESSYDRRSVSPGNPGWFANDDGFGIIRTDSVEGRIEKVMFDETGPGVITRIWITTIDKRGTWRFYFDGSSIPGWTIPAYDLMKINIPGLGLGMLQPHTSYEPEGKGGNTLFLPIPYAKGCKITFEDEVGVNPTPKYYGINYRKYSQNTKIETFSAEVVKRAEKKIAEVDNLLLNPTLSRNGKTVADSRVLAASDSLIIQLPEGENAIYEVKFNVNTKDSIHFDQLMREIIFSAEFDGKQTIWVPLSDFSAGGMGAPYVKSWYLNSDGKGNITSRWLMPYQHNGTLKLINISDSPLDVKLEANVSPLPWDERSLYFHSSWRQETGIPVHIHSEPDKCADWNFSTIEGRGVYKGDLLSLFNHAPRWYGEGDEKIWVDNDTFPSHFGTGTEDYYNSSWAPVVPFHTPFGGAPRADLASSHGYNAFFRTRNLDGIPFKEKMKFDIEMIGWQNGYSDYATTTYWYGDYNSRAIGTSGVEEAKRKLVPTPENPVNYKIANSIEFEELKASDKSASLRLEKQDASDSWDGKWSRAAHLLCRDGKVGDYVEFEFDNLKESKYEVILYATQSFDYGIINFRINNKLSPITFDGYNRNVKHSKPLNLGIFTSTNSKIKLRVEITGANKLSQGARYMFGLDCIQIISK